MITTWYPQALLKAVAVATVFAVSTAPAAAAARTADELEAEWTAAFAAPKLLLNETNTAYGYAASQQFPADPAAYFRDTAKARHLVTAGDNTAAVTLLEELTAAYSDNGDLWGLLGLCQFRRGEWLQAVTAFQKALTLGVTPWDTTLDLNPNDIMVMIAKAFAQAGNRDKAIHWLGEGLRFRFDESPDIAAMPEFEALRDDPAFVALAGLAGPEELSRDDQWRQDIVFLAGRVSLLHSDPDHHTPAPKLAHMLAILYDDVPDLSDEEITARVDLFIGALGAGHDFFWPVSPPRGALKPFALKLFLFTDGLYIIDAYDPALIGARVDAFGDTPTAEAYRRVVEAFPGDNEMDARWMSVRHLSQPYTLAALGIVPDQAVATLRITGADGTRRTITPERRAFTPMSPALAPVPDEKAPLYLTHRKDNTWFEEVPDIKALYVQMKVVRNTEEDSFANFASRMAAAAAKPGIRNLILDLRHSPGGNGYLTPALVRQLIHFDADPDKDHLYVIIGRDTFSASHNLIVDLDRLATPIFVGEPSGSRPNALSETGNFRLPYSGLSGTVATQPHQHSWPEDHRLWIAPDVPVGLSSTDFFAGRDPAMEAITTLINGGGK